MRDFCSSYERTNHSLLISIPYLTNAHVLAIPKPAILQLPRVPPICPTNGRCRQIPRVQITSNSLRVGSAARLMQRQSRSIYIYQINSPFYSTVSFPKIETSMVHGLRLARRDTFILDSRRAEPRITPCCKPLRIYHPGLDPHPG